MHRVFSRRPIVSKSLQDGGSTDFGQWSGTLQCVRSVIAASRGSSGQLLSLLATMVAVKDGKSVSDPRSTALKRYLPAYSTRLPLYVEQESQT